ncbi:hypothetical protein HQK30_11980 [Aeromonas hydrophila]|uniref:abortive infection system antitoxin AbiGi family protein n=1 Tax=Aeromonas dhakensis TaxID=196024 RepID=UPI00159918DC|nr:hypothetical protein HQK30_11980 [Aeromonas hydrophila]
MTPRSRTLFHFTKNIETLKHILTAGFWPRYCSEDTRWHGQVDAQTVAFPMTCFCDIPLSRISDHVKFYGQFGLGMTREWATANGLNPIIYVTEGNNLVTELRKLNQHANALTEHKQAAAKETMRYIYANTKPVNGVMVVDGVPVEKEFYLESEWRYVPQHVNIKAYLMNDIFSNEGLLSLENEKTRQHCRLQLTPKDIKYIFVRSDSDIPEMINFIQTHLDHYPHADTKILMSRITSLESIQGDV